MTNIQYFKGAIDATGCISNAWNLIKPNYGMYLGIAVLAWIMVTCIPCVNFFIMGPVMGGVYYVLLRDMRGEPVDFGMMFKGFEKFGSTLAVGLIQAIPGIVYQIIDLFANVSMKMMELGNIPTGRSGDFYQSSSSDALFAGGVLIFYLIFVFVYALIAAIWAISFVFAIPLVMEHDLGPIDALKLSAKAAWSNVFGVIFLAFLVWIMLVLGVLALCIGIFFVLPMVTSSFAFAYRQVFPALNAPTTYNTPPPPGAYGGTFGQQYGT
jgi:Predicted integral membrane protein